MPTACPGPCNTPWRRAQETGQPHDLTPTWGQPIHCTRCTTRAHQNLAELPELLAAIWLEAVHGTPRPADVTTSRPAGIAPWPGQASRMLTDHILSGMLGLEDGIRQLRHLPARTAVRREGADITSTTRFLRAHLGWALDRFPTVEAAVDPAALIRSWHRAAQRFTSRDPRVEQRRVPCPGCLLLSLFYADGEDYIECRNPACGKLLTDEEYASYVDLYAAGERARRAA